MFLDGAAAEAAWMSTQAEIVGVGADIGIIFGQMRVLAGVSRLD